MSATKFRFWRVLGYPESMPENWEELVEDELVPFACILHDKDADKNGELKKAHIHGVAQWGAPTTEAVASSFAQACGFVAKVKPAKNPPAAVQYLTHLNNPNKYQYPFEAIKTFNGFKLEKYYFALDGDEAMAELHGLVRDFVNFADFADFVGDSRPDLSPCFRSHSAFFDRYIRANAKRRSPWHDDEPGAGETKTS